MADFLEWLIAVLFGCSIGWWRWGFPRTEIGAAFIRGWKSCPGKEGQNAE